MGPEPGAAVVELDLRGEVCPYTFLKAKLAIEALAPGGRIRIVVDNAASARDVPRSLVNAGHAVIACERAGAGAWAILACRGGGRPAGRVPTARPGPSG